MSLPNSSFPTGLADRRAPGIIAALLACCLSFALAQNAVSETAGEDYLINVWLTDQGLPENIVNAIAQTPDGYLWCGTTHGLARFDGVRFKIFNVRNTPELGSARVRQLFVGNDGALWIAVFEGRLVRFKDGRFTAYNLPPRETTAKTIFWITEDESGTLWVTVEDGAVFRFRDGKFTLASKDWDNDGRAVFRVHRDSQGRTWVTTASYLARLENGKLTERLRGKKWEYQFLCPSRSDGWWIVHTGRLRLWRDGQWIADAGTWVRPDRGLEYSLEDHDGHLWVASLGKGIYCYSTNASMQQITVKDGLGSDLVRALFEDAEGNLWAGTRSGGLDRIRPALFKTYGRKQGLSSDLVTAICEGPDGDMWVGIDGEGVNRLHDGEVQKFGPAEGLESPATRALLWDRKGQLWAGTWVGGLYQLDDGRFKPMRDIPGTNTAVGSLFEDSKGRIWVGQRTLNRLACIENGVARAIDLPNPAPSLDETSIAESADGSIWVGTDGNGLYRVTDSGVRRFTHEDGLPSNTVRALFAQPDGSLWIGTLDGGLCRFKDGRFVTCSTSDGLVDDVINHIADDGLGYLWFTSFQGVFRVSKAELNAFADGKRHRIQCAAYGKSDGMPALECPGGFQPAGCRTRDGRLWFPTIKGLVVVDPANVPTNSVVPPVLIEEVMVDGGPAGESAVATKDEVSAPANPQTPGEFKIKPGRHRLEFHYTGLNFAAPERVRFRRQLVGLEKEWVEAGAQRVANYDYLSPGNYEFHVTACNQDGVWNQTGASLAFTVLPYFWQTWWFFVVAVLGGGGLIAGTVYYIVHQKWRREFRRVEMQLSVEKERARIAQDIHDGVGANLTEIAWLAEVAEKDAADPVEVRAQARKISSTARETVQSFDEIVWAVLPQNDTLTSLIGYLGQRVDELFENTPTRCWFAAPNKLPHIVVPAEVRHSFYLACKETLHNVNKHAHATAVKVQVIVQDKELRVEIEDDGCGFNSESNGSTGNGLRNLRQRFENLGGRFELQSRPGQGTKVIMSIPLEPEVAR
jgi:ligand-binding sensor domain-containing protein/signal transduction histidine kinase